MCLSIWPSTALDFEKIEEQAEGIFGARYKNAMQRKQSLFIYFCIQVFLYIRDVLCLGAFKMICCYSLSEENTPLDLDDHGGRTFLRVLLHLTMHDYPPLVSGALHLLFRHFSQRQEVLMAFKQVPTHTHTLNFLRGLMLPLAL